MRFQRLVCLFGAFAFRAFAQSETDYQTWMKTVGATVASLRKNIEAKNGEGRYC